ncbi:hypothetical protein GCM10010916_39080 [Paenibacillus abyssi]|uniref:Uncharacterized protein n=1 Tax=Paenibacillus abyssi TaxID=1340531 RepID=A0A917LFK2_9BACL|nr:hypothetical protein GCM10010916_39080 [Paenibacillus abyssi]
MKWSIAASKGYAIKAIVIDFEKSPANCLNVSFMQHFTTVKSLYIKHTTWAYIEQISTDSLFTMKNISVYARNQMGNAI